MTSEAGSCAALGRLGALLRVLRRLKPRAADIFNHVSSEQQSLDDDFLKDAVTERLKDESPEVVAAALQVLEVSETMVNGSDGVLLDGFVVNGGFRCVSGGAGRCGPRGRRLVSAGSAAQSRSARL